MSELNRPEQHDLEQAEKARDAERHALDKRLSKAESPKIEAKPVGDARSQTQKVKQFQRGFAGVEGMEGVAHSASLDNHNLNDHNGALHQIDVANTLGAENVKEFEAYYKTGKDRGYVDIVTTDDFAVECKFSSDALHPSDIDYAAEQADRRVKSRYYEGVVVVYNDGVLNNGMRDHADTYESPHLRFCERSEVNQVLKKMRAGS